MEKCGGESLRFAAQYSFKDGLDEVTKRYPHLLAEIKEAITAVDASEAKTKLSREKTKIGRMLYSPVALNKAFQNELYPKGWQNLSVDCEYPTTHYLEDYEIRSSLKGAFRDMDFVKDGLGVEVQFGKYSFMVYNVCAKMTIFRNLGFINCGIEIVPVKALALEMSSGVSYFEQFVWDLESRGVANIDIPVLIIGIDA
ncbi:MAG TPA: BglII/BstYI family type II restriction endonuclease [Pyrinomonadaceae bacterium]|nr:BglII/BstYI family type II restriction endonuclease [Pyrinomonadaceae bacterium]